MCIDIAYNVFERDVLTYADAAQVSGRTRHKARLRSIVVLAIFTAAMLIAFVAPRVGFALICGGLVLHLRPEVPGSRMKAQYNLLRLFEVSRVFLRLDQLLLIANARHWSWRCQGTLARIFSISEAVKARMVCVRMLPSMSAASNTLAAVSSSGASKMHTWSY